MLWVIIVEPYIKWFESFIEIRKGKNLLFIGASFKGAKAQCRKMGIYKRKA
jgi:hypothetical protein